MAIDAIEAIYSWRGVEPRESSHECDLDYLCHGSLLGLSLAQINKTTDLGIRFDSHTQIGCVDGRVGVGEQRSTGAGLVAEKEQRAVTGMHLQSILSNSMLRIGRNGLVTFHWEFGPDSNPS